MSLRSKWAAGASATLVGLVIVAISVNLQRIIEQAQLPSRGGATVAALVLILITSMAELIPQSGAALAIKISVFGLLVWLIQLWSARQMGRTEAVPSLIVRRLG